MESNGKEFLRGWNKDRASKRKFRHTLKRFAQFLTKYSNPSIT